MLISLHLFIGRRKENIFMVNGIIYKGINLKENLNTVKWKININLLGIIILIATTFISKKGITIHLSTLQPNH